MHASWQDATVVARRPDGRVGPEDAGPAGPELARRARKAGLAAPRTELADDATLAGWRGPVVVKCRSRWHHGQSTEHRLEARRFADVAQARSRVDHLRDAGFEVVLQEPVDGSLTALAGLFHDGRLVGRVQQVAGGLWPTPTGVSAHARTVPVDDDLAARGVQMLDDLGWSGLVELQFIEREGNHHLIDCNGRFYGSMALALAAGPNLPDAWARQALGLTQPGLPDARPGGTCQWGAGDLRRAVAERRGGLGADLRATAHRWLGRRSTASVWDPRDPGPTWELVRDRLSRRRS